MTGGGLRVYDNKRSVRESFWIPVMVYSGGLLWVSVVAATEISVMADRNPVQLDESFNLIFQAAESPDDDPDFGPWNRILKY